MKSTLKILSFFSLLLLLGGCFEIKEEVDMNNDGSGDLLLTIDMSASKENLKEFMRQGQIGGLQIPDQSSIEQEIKKIKAAVKKTQGMSKVKSTSDYEEFVFTLQGHFANTKALNSAINHAIAAMNAGPFTPKKDNFGYSANEFKRYFKYRIRRGLYEKADIGTRFMLDAARLTSTYRFKKPIKKLSNTSAELSADKKTVQFQSSLAAIAKGERSIENTISF